MCSQSYGAKKGFSYPRGAARQGKAHTYAGPAVGGEAVALGTLAAAGAQLVDAGAAAASVVHRTLVHVCRGATNTASLVSASLVLHKGLYSLYR